ncbi:MAG: hypothetical protein E7396_00880 [Ruminococcaceae bacterium]|nr:hypothetical protein [Oscillospiraceae bacterium]
MKNNTKNLAQEEVIREENVVESAEKDQNAENDTNMRITSLEEKMKAFEDKIDLVASYLEKLNEEKVIQETEKVTEDSITDEKEISAESDEKLIAKNIYEIARKELYNELLPLVECARKYKDREERDKVIKMMILTEEMADAADKADEMDQVIENYPALKNSKDIMEKYVTAYVILKGRDACIANKKKSVEELMDIFENNEEFRNAVSLKIREDIKKQNSVPYMNFEGGITSLNLEEKPKNMQDAKNATFRLFK